MEQVAENIDEFRAIFEKVLITITPKPGEEYYCVYSSHFLVWAFNKFLPGRKPRVVGGGAKAGHGLKTASGVIKPHMWVEFSKKGIDYYADIGADIHGHPKIMLGAASDMMDTHIKDPDEVTAKVLERVYLHEPSFRRMI